MNHILLATTDSSKIDDTKDKILDRELLCIQDTKDLYIKIDGKLVKIGGPSNTIENIIMHNPHFYVGTEEDFEEYKDELEEGALCVINGKVYIRRSGVLKEIIPTEDKRVDGGVLVYNEDTDSFETTDRLKINSQGTAVVNKLIVTDSAKIEHVEIVEAEKVETKNNFIVLRSECPDDVPVPDTGSGIQINNYNGNGDNLRIITTSDGTLKVGKEGDEQPLLTRAEEEDMQDGSPLVWNADNSRAETSSTTYNNQVLVSVVDPDTGKISYKWVPLVSGKVWRGTQAELQKALAITDPNDPGYLQNNAMIIITDDDDDYLEVEVQ